MQKNCTDGQILSQVEIPVHPRFDGVIEAYRIEYLVDGLRVIGFIVKQKNLDQELLPVLIYNRGGNREYGKIDDKRLERLASYASKNYVVLASQYRGNDGGEGQEEFGGADVKDVFALSWLADELPYTDKTRKFMFGHSRGGLMTYICIKLGIDIKAAAVVGAPSNLFRQPLPFPMDLIHAELIGDKEKEVEKYQDRSAVFWPERMNTPILIQHGTEDSRVDVGDATDLAELLKKHNKEHKLVLYPEGDHRLSKFQEDRDREIFKWFEKYM